MYEFQSIKTFFLKAILQISQKKYLLLNNSRILLHGHMFLVIITVKKMLERFVKECRIPIKQGLGLQKKSKDNKLYVNWKGYDSLFNS